MPLEHLWERYVIMIKRGLKDGIPIALGYFSVSFSFGILAASNGFLWWQALLVSIANLTSAGQYAGLTVMAAAGSLIEMAVTQLVINMRYALMSISLTQRLDDKFTRPYRAILGAGITDEIFAVAMNTGRSVKRSYMLGLIIMPYIGWSVGTLAGAVCGNILPDMICDALGIALFGMFIAIVVPVIRDEKPVMAVVAIAVVISCILRYVPVFKGISSGFSVIICAVAAALIGAVLFPDKADKEAAK